MNKPEKNILSRQELENLLPDYAFGNISPEEKISFENSIKNFPDLQNELREIQSSFTSLDKGEYHEFTAQATKNLSVKVLSRMQKNSSEKKNFYLRYIMPGFGAALALLVIMMPDLKEKFSSANPQDQIVSISTGELESIVSELEPSQIPVEVNSPAVVSTHKIAETVKDEKELAQVLRAIVADEIIQTVSSAENTEIIPVTPAASSYDLIEQLDEQDVEQVLKDLSNVDFT